MHSTPLWLRLSIAAALATVPAARAAAQLPNDACATAAVITVGANPYTNVGAQNDPPVWPCGAAARDVWFRFTAPADADYVFDTCTGTSYDSVVQVFSGTCASLVSIACNDDSCGAQSEVLLTNTTAGTEYLVRAGGFIGAQGAGILTVTEIPSLTPLSNQDECANAALDTIGVGEYAWNNSAATTGVEGQTEALCYVFGGSGIQSDVWAVYVSGTDGEVVLQTCDSIAPTNTDTKLAAYPSGACPGIDGSAVACDDNACFLLSRISFAVGCGEAYLIQIGSSPGSGDGAAALSITESGTPCAPGEIGFTPELCDPAVPNSTGAGAEMSAFGSLSVADADVRLAIDNVPAGEFGMFFTATGLQFIPAPGGSLGNICVVGDYARYVGLAQIFAGQGLGSPVPPGGLQVGDIPVPLNPPIAAFTPETWYFQAWYRDAGNSNFSNVVGLVFRP